MFTSFYRCDVYMHAALITRLPRNLDLQKLLPRVKEAAQAGRIITRLLSVHLQQTVPAPLTLLALVNLQAR